MHVHRRNRKIVSAIGAAYLVSKCAVYIGAVYLDDCIVQRFIPIYLVVGGVFGLSGNVSGLVQSVCEQKDPEHQRQPSALSKFFKLFESLIGCFMIAWFIAGQCSHVCLSLSLCVCVWSVEACIYLN